MGGGGGVVLRLQPQIRGHQIFHFIIWAVLSDEQMSNGCQFSLLNDEQMSNWLGVKHQPVIFFFGGGLTKKKQIYARWWFQTFFFKPLLGDMIQFD